MNTPAHLAINLVLLGRKETPKHQAVILFGALLPDLVMFFFYFFEKVINRHSEIDIWSKLYYTPFWQNWFDLFNSIPLIILGVLICYWQKWKIAILFFLSMLLHVAGDIFLHNDDGHRHFFPFSEFRLESPVSYWDPKHYGAIVFPIEIILVFVSVFILYRSAQYTMSRWITSLILATYLFFIVYVFIVWV